MTMSKTIAAISAIAISMFCVKAQTTIGSWTDHLSYNQCISVSSNAKWAYGLSPSGIIKVNLSTSEVNKYSRINQLSEVNLSAFLPLGNGDDYIVGYSNGNIDLFTNNAMTNMPDIKEKMISGSKKINGFEQLGNYVYVLTDFGTVVIDATKKEIKETWYFSKDNNSVACYDIILKDGNYYVATENGLYRASESDQFLTYYATWSLVNSKSQPCMAIDTLNEKIITVYKNGIVYDVANYENDTFTVFTSLSNFKSMNAKGKLTITTASEIQTYTQDLVLSGVKTSYTISGSQSTNVNFSATTPSDSEGDFWISDQTIGLVKSSNVNQDEVFTPTGPLTNNCNRLVHNGEFLIVAPGQQTLSMNKNWFPAQVYFYDGSWTNLTASNAEILAGNFDIINASLDPVNPSKAYLSSWDNGVFVTQDKEVVAHYNPSNSPLMSIYSNDPRYTWVGGAAANKNGDLFMNNCNLFLVGITSNGSFRYESTQFGEGKFGDLIIDKSGYIWTYFRRHSIKSGLFVYDTNQTPDNQQDDRYRGPRSVSEDPDFRNYGAIPLYDQEGVEVTAEVYSIAEDKNGYIWLGTAKGPLVYYSPWSLFEDTSPTFNRIKIPRNEGDNLADYLLESETINCITVDGANRKWLGTRSSGAFLVSEDGTSTIYSFNTSNSPLVSNTINSITVDPVKGDVYFGTDLGIVSFKGTATGGAKTYSDVYTYPNPVRPGYTGSITVKGLVANSNVKITSMNGALVYETKSLGGQVVWDGCNSWGEPVKTGVYLVYMTDQTGQASAVSKILITR